MSDDRWLPDEEYEEGYVRRAKREILELVRSRPGDCFYERQLQIRYERSFYHWITSRAIDDLAEAGDIRSEFLPLTAVGRPIQQRVQIRVLFAPGQRYWLRRASKMVALVARYSDPQITRAVGHQAEMLFDAGLARVGFIPVAEVTREFNGKKWEETAHDLDRIYVRDDIAYGTEIKNKLAYPDWGDEIEIKLRMCRYLNLKPLIISRALPKSWIYDIESAYGGFALVFRYQLYPFGFETFTREIREK
jgi:hypothetical protein